MTGRRLALISAEGRINIMESDVARTARITLQRRNWSSSSLTEGDTLAGIPLRQSAIAFQESGGISLLVTKAFLKAGAPPHWQVVLGAWNGSSYRRDVLREFGPLDLQSLDRVKLSLAFTQSRGEILAVHRRPTQGNDGELLLDSQAVSRGSGSGKAPTEIIDTAGNWGFHTHISPGVAGESKTIHFDEEYRGLSQFTHSKDGWSFKRIGRHGDGRAAETAFGPGNETQLAFCPLRFDGDPSPLTYLRPGPPEVREVIDPTTDCRMLRLSLSPGGTPMALYTRRASEGRWVVVAAHRRNGQWENQVVFDWRRGAISNLWCDTSGVLRFAFIEIGSEGRLELATGKEGAWEVETIGRIPLSSGDGQEDQFDISAGLRL